MFHIHKITCSAFAVFSILALQAQKNIRITLNNPIALQRNDERVVMSRKQLEKMAGPLAASVFVIVGTKEGQPLVVQHDDLNSDGVWDEIAFMSSFIPRERKALQVSFSTSPAAIKAVVRAHVRHRRKNADDTFGPPLEKDSIAAGQPATDFSKQALPPFLTEGPAWENDKVGFRLYFDVRNAKDIWGKTSAEMILDEVGENPAINYHHLADWGMDILKVGSSLGAGALALQVSLPNRKDTLIRLGGVNMGKVIYERLADGPVRATFRLQYPEWKILKGVPSVSIEEEISIWGGQYFYESKVKVKRVPKGAKLVTGIVNLHDNRFQACRDNGTQVLFSHGRQSENNDTLGMALLLPSGNVSAVAAATGTNSDIRNTYLALQDIKEQQPCVFRFYAGWEKTNPRFAVVNEFKSFLEEEAQKMDNPIRFQR